MGQEEVSESFGFEEEDGDETLPVAAGKWEPRKYDHHGYLLKADDKNDTVRLDEHGYRVEID